MTPDNQNSPKGLTRYDWQVVGVGVFAEPRMLKRKNGEFVRYEDHLRALASLPAVPQGAEPVAWMHPESPGTCISAREYADGVKYGWERYKHYTIPLYTHPAPSIIATPKNNNTESNS